MTEKVFEFEIWKYFDFSSFLGYEGEFGFYETYKDMFEKIKF